MITGYGLILEDDILYCSNEEKYSIFEIVLFVEKFLRSFNPKQTWRLNHIYLKSADKERERILIRHFLTEAKKNLFILVCGSFKESSQEIRSLLLEFSEKVRVYYNTEDILNNASKRPIFNEIIRIITDYLGDKYEPLLDKEEMKTEVDHGTTNTILYGGISTQGLPIITRLFDPTLLSNLDKEMTDENIDLFNSNLSGQLATIEMNTLIRTGKYKIKEIHIADLVDIKNKKIILFDSIGTYSLAIFASGNFFEIKDIMKLLKIQVTKEEILKQEFSGDLKPFRYLDKYFSSLENEF